jgi:uncharacterized protein (DUF433 family)
MTIQTESPPITQWPDGSLRVGQTRVLVDLIIHEFQGGATAEQIVQSYGVALADAYSVIGYYLRHQAEVDAYLTARDEKASEVRQRIEDNQGDLGDIRARLLARKQARD